MIAITSAYQQHLILNKINNLVIKKIHSYKVQWISIKPTKKRKRLYQKVEKLY